MSFRRLRVFAFTVLSLGIFWGASAPALVAQPTTLRLVAANLTSGNSQSYDPGEGTRILQGLRPDVAFVQEFNFGNNSTTAIRSWVDTAFGNTFSYFRESAGAGDIPNGIVSRYPILAAGEWNDPEVANRDFVWARINVPGALDLWAVSVHLLTTDSRRPAEATALVGFINAHVPAGDLLAIGGDFNSDTRTETALNTLGSVVMTSGPQPVDSAGDPDTNAGRSKPYDGVYVDADLAARQIPVQLADYSFVSGLVFDSRVYPSLGDVSPVRVGDSGATNMQHMAVVKDFQLATTAVPEPATYATLVGAIVLFATGIVRRRSKR